MNTVKLAVIPFVLCLCTACKKKAEPTPLPPEQVEVLATRLLDGPDGRGQATGVRFEAKDAKGNPLKTVYYTARLEFVKMEHGDRVTLYLDVYRKPVADSFELQRAPFGQSSSFDCVYNFPSELDEHVGLFTYSLVVNNQSISTYPTCILTDPCF